MQHLPGGLIKLLPNETLPECFIGKYSLIPGERDLYKVTFPLCIYHTQATKCFPNCNRCVIDEWCSLKEVFISPKGCAVCKERREDGI